MVDFHGANISVVEVNECNQEAWHPEPSVIQVLIKILILYTTTRCTCRAHISAMAQCRYR